MAAAADAAAGKDDRCGGGGADRHNTQQALRAGNLLFWSDSFRLPDLREGREKEGEDY